AGRSAASPWCSPWPASSAWRRRCWPSTPVTTASSRRPMPSRPRSRRWPQHDAEWQKKRELSRVGRALAGVLPTIINPKERPMRRRWFLWIGLGLLALMAGGASAWVATLPPAPPPPNPPEISPEEQAATLSALKPPKRARPLVAVIGLNDATETTDYLMPLGILRRSGAVDVVALSIRPGPVRLYPALQVKPDATAADFEARHPDGADYVIVPAMSRI